MSDYLGVPYIRDAGEVFIICAAIAGSGLGFLWFNTYPAQVFMGDVGALSLGAALGLIAVISQTGSGSCSYGWSFYLRDNVSHFASWFF